MDGLKTVADISGGRVTKPWLHCVIRIVSVQLSGHVCVCVRACVHPYVCGCVWSVPPPGGKAPDLTSFGSSINAKHVQKDFFDLLVLG